MRRLPVASSEPERAPGAPSPSEPPSEAEAPSPERAGDEVSSIRLIATLAVAGALAGLLIVVVFQWADPRIQAYRAQVLADAIQEVLAGPAGFVTLYVHDGRLVEEAPAGADTAKMERVYLGVDAAGAPTGFAIPGAEPGFQDLIHLIFGYDVGSEKVLGMRVLESKETPGLGDKIIKDSSFVAEFDGAVAPLEGVKPGAGEGGADEVDMITGATISSRTVIEIINHRVEALQPLLREYMRERGGELARAPAVGGAPDARAGDANVARPAGSGGGS